LSRPWRPVAPDALATLVAGYLHEVPTRGAALRVALDAPRCADPVRWASEVADALRPLGLPSVVISADTFWRDASLRLEHGREDALAYRTWLDVDALRREVLDPLGPGGSGRYLPSLRNPDTNRSSRESHRCAVPGTVVLVAGEFLLAPALPFDVRVRLWLSAAALARRTPPDQHWTLDAHRDYDRSLATAEVADIVVKLDDPRHPAVSMR
jgi:hypothetical protein